MPPAVLCKLHITNQHSVLEAVDWGLDYLILTNTESGNAEDVYLAAIPSAGGADTVMYASAGTSDGPLDLPYITAFIAQNSAFPPPDLLGFLPRPMSRAVRTNWTTGAGHSQHVVSGQPQTEDRYTLQQIVGTSNTGGLYIANPSGSSFVLSQSITSSLLITMTATDLGIETIPSGCSVGPGIPTRAVHISYTNLTGDAGQESIRRTPARTSSSISPASAQGLNLDEWVRRDVGVVCRSFTEGSYYTGYTSMQSYAP
jgi:hypothetical protein